MDAYTNRDICRWEMYLGSSLPLSSFSEVKRSLLHGGLPEMIKLKKRMHFLYDSNMQRQGFLPFSLPLSSKLYQSLLPKVCYSNKTLAASSSAYFLSEKQQTARSLLQKQSCSEADGGRHEQVRRAFGNESDSFGDDNPLPVHIVSKPPHVNVVDEKPFMKMPRPLPLIAALHTEIKTGDENDRLDYFTGYQIRLLENGDQYEGE